MGVGRLVASLAKGSFLTTRGSNRFGGLMRFPAHIRFLESIFTRLSLSRSLRCSWSTSALGYTDSSSTRETRGAHRSLRKARKARALGARHRSRFFGPRLPSGLEDFLVIGMGNNLIQEYAGSINVMFLVIFAHLIKLMAELKKQIRSQVSCS
ncbi:uncharacterized protein BDR25DRAFT_65247 [Lindgomyces ingoldianus]|uniref:Uncharacterized protein n=1 Tax=Lindgomyces ingoldianus TaxID=673940 RepID=A0ACB6RB56_9PLEO|nr:uncharacterized protein BDR25DRAFT_65247 [Lindgomyces ingoldianus]KAF2476327.1 hypothetical protein BDR25DRAFT_65247 [Lindgomyces ingoldianus]